MLVVGPIQTWANESGQGATVDNTVDRNEEEPVANQIAYQLGRLTGYVLVFVIKAINSVIYAIQDVDRAISNGFVGTIETSAAEKNKTSVAEPARQLQALFNKPIASGGESLEQQSEPTASVALPYTKLDSSGNPLVIQEQDYSTYPWACAEAGDTGLVWEVKTDNEYDLQHKGWTYTWYNGEAPVSGGAGDTGQGTTNLYDNQGGMVAGSDNCFMNDRCDTQKYLEDINAAGLCGYNDWRLPTVEELKSLVDLNQPAAPFIDTAYFPNTVASTVWSVSADENNSLNAGELNFDDGKEGTASKVLGRSVRLVRGEQKDSDGDGVGDLADTFPEDSTQS